MTYINVIDFCIIRYMLVLNQCIWHALSFGEWLTVMATHTIFSQGSTEWLVNWLHLRICLLVYDNGSCRTNYSDKLFNWVIGHWFPCDVQFQRKGTIICLVTNYRRALQNTWQGMMSGPHRPKPFPSPKDSCPCNPLARHMTVFVSRNLGYNLHAWYENYNLYPLGYDVIRRLTTSF